MKETEQTLLDQIKDQVAKENRFSKWTDIVQNVPDDHEFRYWPIVCERYAEAKAKASCEATLQTTAKSVTKKHGIGYEKSILDKSNITIV